ncbi:hypothetical protein FB567DRAFT_191895 [Paraphoma chrysanthemicola]|uniref:Uncharacterized protein n=1 Tax=Paraphoma chrysanthemicola TaxID=798071 RepID=A0A8K0VT60_9PLEO|nr:hypothetical protein FB567DRAFT_191895 [Paraphoma chrysanthemicola]
MSQRDLHLLRHKAIEYIHESDAVQLAIKTERAKEPLVKNTYANPPPPSGGVGSTVPSQRLSYLETRKGIIESCIRDTLKPYAQAICLHFSKKVLSKLPREMRDIVYEYLVTPDYIWVGTEYFTNTGPPCDVQRDAHFWSPAYVGDAMQAEIVQTWYRTSLFYLWNRAKNHELIERFLTQDRWGIGVLPHEHISRLRFDLGDDLIHQREIRVHVPGRSRQERCLDERYVPALTAPLKTVLRFTFPNRAHFLIRIHTLGSLETACLSGTLLDKTLEEILADLKTLKASGQRWTVQWSEMPTLEFTSAERELAVQTWKEAIELERRRARF